MPEDAVLRMHRNLLYRTDFLPAPRDHKILCFASMLRVRDKIFPVSVISRRIRLRLCDTNFGQGSREKTFFLLVHAKQ
jgi:hypothetical protein